MVMAYLLNRRKAFQPIIDDGGTVPDSWLALRMNGIDEGTTFTDSSPNVRTVTVNGTIVTDQNVKQYGTASGRWSVGNSWLQVSGTPNFGSSDFTVEWWLRNNSTSEEYARVFQAVLGDTISSLGCNIEFGTIRLYSSSNAATWNLINGLTVGTPSNSVFRHFAVCRSGTTVRTFQDGSQVSSTSVGTTALMYNAAHNFTIGGQTGRTIRGWIDEFCVTPGIAKYTGPFTPGPLA